MRNPRWLWLAVAVSILISGLAFMDAIDGKAEQVDTAKTRAKDAAKEKDAVVSDASTLAQQVTQACKESKGKALSDLRDAGLCQQAAATKETIDSTVSSTPVMIGPSQAQVNSAVRALLLGMDLTGPAGPPPTPAQIAAAIADYCDGRAQCTGAKGADGAPGAKGADGAPGAPGKDAPIITSAYCNTDERIVLVFDNGSEVVVTDSDCKAL